MSASGVVARHCWVHVYRLVSHAAFAETRAHAFATWLARARTTCITVEAATRGRAVVAAPRHGVHRTDVLEVVGDVPT